MFIFNENLTDSLKAHCFWLFFWRKSCQTSQMSSPGRSSLRSSGRLQLRRECLFLHLLSTLFEFTQIKNQSGLEVFRTCIACQQIYRWHNSHLLKSTCSNKSFNWEENSMLVGCRLTPAEYILSLKSFWHTHEKCVESKPQCSTWENSRFVLLLSGGLSGTQAGVRKGIWAWWKDIY